jgi:putative component of membrane protein insertase Oxa1/YidC/SpoIIIJ protein YidD
VFIFYTSVGQQENKIHVQILKSYFQEPNSGIQKKRAMMQKKGTSNAWYFLSGAMIYFYQNYISEQIQATCTYQISCSEYIKLCIQEYGFFHGTLAGLNQYMKCSPNNFKNHLAYRLNEDNKIINSIKDE